MACSACCQTRQRRARRAPCQTAYRRHGRLGVVHQQQTIVGSRYQRVRQPAPSPAPSSGRLSPCSWLPAAALNADIYAVAAAMDAAVSGGGVWVAAAPPQLGPRAAAAVDRLGLACSHAPPHPPCLPAGSSSFLSWHVVEAMDTRSVRCLEQVLPPACPPCLLAGRAWQQAATACAAILHSSASSGASHDGATGPGISSAAREGPAAGAAEPGRKRACKDSFAAMAVQYRERPAQRMQRQRTHGSGGPPAAVPGPLLSGHAETAKQACPAREGGGGAPLTRTGVVSGMRQRVIYTSTATTFC